MYLLKKLLLQRKRFPNNRTSVHGDNREDVSIDTELDVAASEGHPVDALRVVVVMGPGIQGERADNLVGLCPYPAPQLVGKDDSELAPLAVVGEPATRVGVAVGVWDVGFDVVDGGAVHEIGAADNEFSPTDLHQAHRRETQSVGTEGTARSKDTQPLVASKTRRTHGQAARVLIGRESPYQPDIVEVLQSTYGIGMPVVLFEDDASAQFFHESALARYAELCREGRAEKGDGFYLFHSAKVRIIRDITDKSHRFIFNQASVFTDFYYFCSQKDNQH